MTPELQVCLSRGCCVLKHVTTCPSQVSQPVLQIAEITRIKTILWYKMLDYKCIRAALSLLITFLILSGVYFQYNNDDINQTKTRSNINKRKGKPVGDASFVYKTELEKSPVQSERFELLSSVCEKYKRTPSQHEKYILQPGRQIRGKFTFEPKSKLVFCNIMKQGEFCCF